MKQHYDTFWTHLKETKLESWITQLPSLLETATNPENNGNLSRWLTILESIRTYPAADHYALNQSAITISSPPSLRPEKIAELETALRGLHPWRKGPFNIHGIQIDTEWRSDWKWERVCPYLSPLKGKKVLDIGCGSGYHLWRMMGEGAELAVGVDPNLLSMSQFLTLKHFIGKDVPAYFLPLTLEQLPLSTKGGAFDTVFSMGVLYHRRSPIDHIYDLKQHLVPGGELVLETLVIPDDYSQILIPEDRYAQMRNVWFLPTVKELTHWLKRCGFENIRCVDKNQTNTKEQRTTDWMQWNSLENFLNPENHNQTIEGYPAPLRAVMVCNTPK
ncbi:MAG: tRNA 5-methoxyuridine(34)/uridine 5-oxyacetic acid(34) synthase CmoB [Thiomicrorhabdus sp.]|nr:tRNA 5-methoxyuridine(34)/uridine 5-oxyacetic acid(34) synthase CmoB [Thiomicrorhabdus sp.]